MENKKPIKIKFKTAVIFVVIIVLTILGMGGANVYASSHGYGNVFFLIKYKITGQKPNTFDGKQELQEDNNTISNDISESDVNTTNNTIVNKTNTENQYSNITIDGRYAIECTDVIYTFSKDGKVERGGSVNAEIGTYKVTKDKIIEIIYKEQIIWDIDTSEESKNKITEEEKLKYVNENLLTSIDGREKYIRYYEKNDVNDKNIQSVDKQDNIISQLAPSGFSGSSLHMVELHSNKEVYLIVYDGNGYNESNIVSKELIAKNADSISKNAEGNIIIKGGEKIEASHNWIIFEDSIISQLAPSGFSGSSLHMVELHSNKEVYLIVFDGNGYNEKNIVSKELIAKNVDSISKNAEGDIIIKGGEKIEASHNWIIFEK